MTRVARLPRYLAATLALAAAAAAQAAPPPPPAALQGAREIAALPDGAWLALDKKALRLLGADGREHARLALRGQQLDTRPALHGALAVVLDADTQRTLALTVDTQAMTLSTRTAVESPAFPVEASCLYRDGQGLDHLFVVADDGLAEQWLLGTGPARLVRRLALPPQTQACRVDDASGWLYAQEEDAGVWAYRAEAEGASRRRAVALVGPLGPLRGGVQAMALLPGGLATVDGRGRLQLWREDEGRWKATGKAQRTGARGGIEALAATADAGSLLLAWRDEEDGRWSSTSRPWTPPAARQQLPVVHAVAQTDPVPRFGDAADDPAIWVHPGDATQSLVLGTNKKQGLFVYGLDGRQRQVLEAGRLNNVDLRQGLRFGALTLDLALATQRDEKALAVFTIAADGTLADAGRVATGLDDVYGTCLYAPPAGGLEALVNDKDGRVERIRIEASAGADGKPRFSGRVVQRFRLQTQPEGCVADDRAGRLFIGEEDRGVWALSLADTGPAPKLDLVLKVAGLLQADVEGLALYHDRKAGRSWLVVSSQGNDSYLVAEAAPPWRVRGAFRIGVNAAAGIDGASETDGLETTSAPLGAALPRGALVVQDGHKRLPDGAQNFKIVDWREVERVLGLN
ncbi:3-phytase [Rubrivivax gelatinosus]|nr:3-phytase [Rubrivivax gelatinosus]